MKVKSRELKEFVNKLKRYRTLLATG